LVASFETIEHISEHDAFLSEIKRVLAPGGILVISSPHKAEYQKVSEAANPFHQAELDHDEFVQLITKRFKHCVAAKQRLVIGSWIAPDEPSAQVSTATFRGWFDEIDIENGVHRGLYSIAVCSDQPLPVFNLGMFENLQDSADTWNLLDTYDTPAQISARLIELTKAGEEKAMLVLQLQGEAEKKSQQLAEFEKELAARSKHVVQLEREGEEKSKQVAQFKSEADEGSRQAAQLKRENEQQSRHLERLKNQSELADDRLARAKNELLDARWEALTLRGTLLRKSDSAETPFSRILELENRVETTTSERDHLRAMLASLQNDLERERLAGQARQGELRAIQDQLRATQDQLDTTQAQLKTTAKDLRSEQKQMDRLRASMSHKLILPFGKSQRKLQQLTASRRADD
jgi:hypothetical protein